MGHPFRKRLCCAGTAAGGRRTESSTVAGQITSGTKPEEPALSGPSLVQGGHAGGGVASEEELARPGRFVKIGRSGMPTDQGKTPDFNLGPGEAGYQVLPDGSHRLAAGVDTPTTLRGLQEYKKARGLVKTTPQSPALSEPGMPQERSTGVPEHDEIIRSAGAVPGGRMANLALYHDPTSGTTLATDVNQLSKQAIVDNLTRSRVDYAPGRAVENMKKTGGFTFNPHTGQVPTDGYMVETHLDRGRDLGHQPTTDDIRKYIQDNKDLLDKNPNLHIGGWRNTLGLSEQFEDVNAAKKLGQDTNQVSIYDLKNGKEIPTGGTGGVPQKTTFSGVHYSPVEQTGIIPGASRGQAMTGEEAARLQHENKVPGVYAYAEGTKPEPQIGSRQFKYNIGGQKAIADIGENGPQKQMFQDAFDKAREAYQKAGNNDTIATQKALNDAERALLNAGYDGYTSDRYPGSTFLFGDQQITQGTKPQNPALSEDRISTRVPLGKNATENPLEGKPLTIGREAIDKAPEKLQTKFAGKIQEIPGVKIPKNITDSGKIIDRFTRHVADNLKWLYNQVPKEQRSANAKWYDSANKLATDMADQHGFTPRQTAGVIAALSPQMDWDMNVSLAKRLTDIYKNHMDDTVSPEMISKARDIISGSRKGTNKVANTNLEQMLDNIAGKKISDLQGLERAAAVRLYDETNNPTGNEAELRTTNSGNAANVAWGNLGNITKALSILDDGSRENISQQVGDSHKVRNFYNNIIDPSNSQDVTVDTHAVAAALLHPVGGNDKIVMDNFGAGGKNLATGIKGTYPLYAEGYRLAAKDLHLKPRELQSIVWEKIRNMFPTDWKSQENLAAVQKEWNKYADGKQTIDQTRQNVLKMSEIARAEVDAARTAATEKARQKAEQEQKSPLAGKKISALDFIKALRDNKAGANALKGQ